MTEKETYVINENERVYYFDDGATYIYSDEDDNFTLGTTIVVEVDQYENFKKASRCNHVIYMDGKWFDAYGQHEYEDLTILSEEELFQRSTVEDITRLLRAQTVIKEIYETKNQKQ